MPKDYLLDATDWHRQPEAFAPRKATPYFGYGYQFWLFPGEKRRFALLGVYGQSIFVDPELKLVMVITAAAKNASVGKESFAANATRCGAGSSADTEAGDYRLLVPSLGMHLRVRSTPDVVICEPWTSLICPAGHEPSSTMTRWPSRRSTMSCSRETACAMAAVASSHSARPAGRASASGSLRRHQSGLAHLVLIFSPSGPTLICRPSGSCLAL